MSENIVPGDSGGQFFRHVFVKEGVKYGIKDITLCSSAGDCEKDGNEGYLTVCGGQSAAGRIISQ